MPFGSRLGSASNITSSGGTSISTSTSLTVSVGDLVFVAFGSKASPTTVTFSDNLGNTWTSLTSNSTSACLFAAYTVVTVAGSMTPTATYASQTLETVILAAQYSGPFTSPALDTNPPCDTGTVAGGVAGPATGTLAQANELIISYASSLSATVPTAGAGFTLDIGQGGGSGSNKCNGGIESQVVSSTASVAPTWGTTLKIGTASFKERISAANFQYLRRQFIRAQTFQG